VKTKILLFIACLVILGSSCKKTDDGWRIIQIKAGDHYSSTWHPEVVPAKYGFYFILDVSCIYDETNINQWNKIAGWSEAENLQHSVRLAWMCSRGKILVGYFIHSYGHVYSGVLDTIQPNKVYYGRVAFEDNGYTAEANGHVYRFPEAHRPVVCWKNYPYFGGDVPAPHTMEIRLKND
jgi:hypothetical protein